LNAVAECPIIATSALIIYVQGCTCVRGLTGSWKTYLVGTRLKFGKMHLKVPAIFTQSIFIAHLDKAIIKLSLL